MILANSKNSIYIIKQIKIFRNKAYLSRLMSIISSVPHSVFLTCVCSLGSGADGQRRSASVASALADGSE